MDIQDKLASRFADPRIVQPDEISREAHAEIARLRAELAEYSPAHIKLDRALTPRLWTAEMSEAWHRAIPDVPAAFAALREAATP